MINTQKRLHKYCLILVTALIFGCRDNKTTDVYSYQIDNKTEKFETLKKYVGKESGLIDAEYHIWYQDNSPGILPAPSDYKFKLALKVEPDSFDSWVKGLKPSSEKISINLWDELKLDRNFWRLESEPELYLSSFTTRVEFATEVKLLFRKENIILGFYSTSPYSLLDE